MIKKPQILDRNEELPQSIPANVIYVKEEKPPKGLEPIEWFLMTNDEVNSEEQAFEKVRYYVQRWKTGMFHHALKSGCAIEKLQERDMEKTKTADIDAFGNSGVYYEPDVYSADKPRTAVYDTV
jgi:hypothetical protein